jgi:hypothetical protein
MLYGFIGFILALVLFGSGVFCGFKGCEKLREKNRAAFEKQIGEEERRRLLEDQSAFRTLVNYSPEIAYGLNINDYIDEGERAVE